MLQDSDEIIKDLQYKISNEVMAQTYEQFYKNLPIFLDEKDYRHIESHLSNDSLKVIVERNYRTLLSPSGVFLGKFLQKDPLSITALALRKIQDLQFDPNFQTNEGYIQTLDQK